MKDNTLLYVALGVGVIYLISKKTAAPTTALPSGTALVNQPSGVQASGIIAPLLTSAASAVTSFLNSQKAATNVANGYNADGTIPDSNTGGQSVSQLLQPAGSSDPASQLLTINTPVIDTTLPANPGSPDPSGSDVPDELTFF